VPELRLVVLAVASLTTLVKLVVAARSFGTNDVHYWTQFAAGVREFGPIGVYGHRFELQVYNHPPLIGWMLQTFNFLTDHGLAFPFLIRVPSSLADLGTAVLVFEILRHRIPVGQATAAALLYALSPLMVIVSGFHGNTDPVFAFASMLTLYLVAVRGRLALAGLVFGIAVSIKLVPVVIAPLMLVLLLRRGLVPTVRFVSGGMVVLLVLWLPVLVLRGPEFTDQVLNYDGIPGTEWGIPELLKWLGVSDLHVATLRSHARAPVLLLASLVPAALVWRRPSAWPAAFGLSFAILLLLSPAFGMQYLVWPLAAAYLVDWRAATVYNAAASLFAYVVYAHWNADTWWHWDEAKAAAFTRGELPLMTAAWASLLLVILWGLLKHTIWYDAGTSRPHTVSDDRDDGVPEHTAATGSDNPEGRA
jgi:hypothetical protein